jgi:hypothetical protein
VLPASGSSTVPAVQPPFTLPGISLALPAQGIWPANVPTPATFSSGGGDRLAQQEMRPELTPPANRPDSANFEDLDAEDSEDSDGLDTPAPPARPDRAQPPSLTPLSPEDGSRSEAQRWEAWPGDAPAPPLAADGRPSPVPGRPPLHGILPDGAEVVPSIVDEVARVGRIRPNGPAVEEAGDGAGGDGQLGADPGVPVQVRLG